MYKKERTPARLNRLCLRLGTVLLAVNTLGVSVLAAPATVNAQGGLRMRAQASTSAQVLSTLANGAKVEVLEAMDGWYRIEASGKTGYVSGQYLSVTGTVSASSLNVRSTPSTSGAKVTTLSNGASVEILNTLDGWFEVQVGGQKGYVASQYVSLSKEIHQLAPAGKIYGTVTSTLNVRSGPGSSHSKVATLSAGTKVEILEQQDNWYRIDKGYVSALYVTVPAGQTIPLAQSVSETDSVPEQAQTEAPPADQSQQPETPAADAKTHAMVTASTLNVRSGPGASHQKVGTLSAGAQVEILETVNGWYRIDKGYVSADYLLVLDGSMSALQAQIVAYARSFLGLPYVYGGNGPNSFDCSGLTKYVYKHFGYTLNRGATSQLKNGVVVSKEDLQPGDLVFFNSEGTGIDRATHVGIYIGNGEFLHASNKRLGVTITSLSDPYRLRTYTTARRIL